MIATAFGASGVLGIAMLYTAVLLAEYGLWMFLQRYGWTGMLAANAAAAAASYVYVTVGYAWLVRHIGNDATYAATGILSFLGLIFLYQNIAWMLRAIK